MWEPNFYTHNILSESHLSWLVKECVCLHNKSNRKTQTNNLKLCFGGECYMYDIQRHIMINHKKKLFQFSIKPFGVFLCVLYKRTVFGLMEFTCSHFEIVTKLETSVCGSWVHNVVCSIVRICKRKKQVPRYLLRGFWDSCIR